MNSHERSLCAFFSDMLNWTIASLILGMIVVPAWGDSIVGDLSVFPYARWNYPNDTIKSWAGSTLPTTGTGDFAPFVSGSSLVLQNPNQTISFSDLGTNSNLFCGSTCLFALAPAAWFNVTSITDLGGSFQGTPTHQWIGTGIMTLAGFDPTLSDFAISIQHGMFGHYDTWATIGVHTNPVGVPGPIVGAGVPGLIVASAFLMLLARRRRALAMK